MSRGFRAPVTDFICCSGGRAEGGGRQWRTDEDLELLELDAEQLGGLAPLLQGAGQLGRLLLQGLLLLRVHLPQHTGHLALQLLDLDVLGEGGAGL